VTLEKTGRKRLAWAHRISPALRCRTDRSHGAKRGWPVWHATANLPERLERHWVDLGRPQLSGVSDLNDQELQEFAALMKQNTAKWPGWWSSCGN